MLRSYLYDVSWVSATWSAIVRRRSFCCALGIMANHVRNGAFLTRVGEEARGDKGQIAQKPIILWL